ncbi:hypothetical protein Noda2021_10580 [Candidatus Dependentiae bacterium Noda2021]|nr:hypothetical protein Noda2021_10580 [Candidatus Dependentiae bacterium Noda2021]
MKKIIVLTLAMISSASCVHASIETRTNDLIRTLTPALSARSLARDAAYIAAKSCPNAQSVVTPLGTVDTADLARYIVAVILQTNNYKGALATIGHQAFEDLSMYGFNTLNTTVNQVADQAKLGCVSNFIRKVNSMFAKDTLGNYIIRWLIRGKTQEIFRSPNVKSVQR